MSTTNGNGIRLPIVLILGALVAACSVAFGFTYNHINRVENHASAEAREIKRDFEGRMDRIREDMQTMKTEIREDIGELKLLIQNYYQKQ